jgi:4'-phosphopantetheinyl transferase
MLHRPRHTIGEHEIHVWHLFADELTDDATQNALRDLLNSAELDRMARLRSEADRTLYLLSRGLTRTVLASYLGCQGGDVRFAASDFGKPILHADHQPRVIFNLTHSGGAAALAVSSGREVGIDIEQRERDVDFLALAQRFFAAAEAEHLVSLSDEQRRRAFFAIWTLKEAFVKGIGRGLTFPLDAFCFDLELDRLLRFRPLAASVSPHWHFQQFSLGDDHSGAVAVQTSEANKLHIVMRDWRSTFLP